jgi:hypothetical protein
MPLFLFFILTWRFFISNNFFYYRIKPLSTDIINKTTPFKKLNYVVFLKWNLINLWMLSLSIFIIKSDSINFFWNHLTFNNFKFWCFFIFIFINSLLFFYFKIITKNNIPQSIDFFFALVNLSVFTPLIFASNTFYTLFFIMEVISCFLFYKFAVSKIWFNINISNPTQQKNKFSKNFPKEYISMLFFQFWSTFFSSILILVSLLNLFYMLGTSEWIYINYLNVLNFNINYFDNYNFFFYMFLPLLIGVFFKLGVTPLHLYKIEVYKGLPFITIFFYTTYFFLIWVIFFSYLLMFLLFTFSNFWVIYITVGFILGVIFVISLIFDVRYMKAFFAYSTIINAVLILLILLIYFNV